ncbi:MAG: glycosyltransferase family 39 protein [Phycicoccus sp.]
MREVQPFAWRLVVPAAVANALVLTLASGGYGWSRDELYFRMLRPAWGYVDQPPLAPFLARTLGAVADEPWAVRMPAALACAVSVVLLALVTRELGGGAAAQGGAAWCYAFALFPLILGHLLLTSSLDLAFLLLVVLFTVRAASGQRWSWVWAGVAIGAATYNRLLVVAVAGALVVGLLALGPRSALRTRWPWAGALTALAVAAPNIAYQASTGWPQLAMGAALSEDNADDVRAQLPLVLIVMFGIPLAVVWLRGLWWLVARPQRARFGFLGVAAVVVVAFTWVSGTQPHYPVHLLSVCLAAGCVALAPGVSASGRKRVAAGVVMALNAAACAVIALPVVPLGSVASTAIPDVNPLVGETVGFEEHSRQVAEVYRRAGGRAAGAAIVTSNYGQAGALAHYGPELGLPRPHSGHNALYDEGPPPEDTDVVVFVGGRLDEARPLFGSCEAVAALDNGVGVDTEEQGMPVAVCRDPIAPWRELWPRLRHLD